MYSNVIYSKKFQFFFQHFESQVKNLNQLLKTQTDTYSSLEVQIDDLSNKYSDLLEDCGKYRNKNNTLWRRVEWLEKECEEYLEEITLLKEEKDNAGEWTMKPDEIQEEQIEKEDEENVQQHQQQQQQQELLKSDKIVVENTFLKEKLFLYEEDNIKLMDEIENLTNRLDKMSRDTYFMKTSEENPYQNKSSYRSFAEEKNNSTDVKVTPTVQHYHEIFAAIFKRLKTVERNTGE